MEEMEHAGRERENTQIKNTEPWYEKYMSLEDVRTFIKANITTAARSFIAIGFYLKRVRDRELFKEENYTDVWEFAKSEYGISKSTASRYMSMNDRFSENGNSPNIRQEYRAFGKSQLQEMLYLDSEQLEKVKPEDRVEDIRNMRRTKEIPYIELPGQMEFEADFPEVFPDQQILDMGQKGQEKQVFELHVEDFMMDQREEMGGAVAISQQEDAAYVKEQYRLQTSFLYPFAVWLIKNHKNWFLVDYTNRVLHVDQSEPQLKAYLGASQSGFRSFGFPANDDTYYAKMYDKGIEISHFTETGDTVIDGISEWFYLAASIQSMWNEAALKAVQEKEKDGIPNSGFNSNPTSCLYRKEYSCTVSDENRTICGDGQNCANSCCWLCVFHSACKQECNSSASRDGKIPAYDAVWFVKEWAARVPEDLEIVLKVCRESSTNAERAKAVQKKISPYGAYILSCLEYNFSFHSFTGGVDFRIGKVTIHLKYGRFVQELIALYTDFKLNDEKEPGAKTEEIIIDTEFKEIPQEEKLTPAYFLEREKGKLERLLRASEGIELKPGDIEVIERQKTIVAALASMVCDLETAELKKQLESEKPKKPALPVLRNNDQRAAFIDAYETWPVWIETEKTGERYYRYDLPDSTSIVVKVYHAMLFDHKKAAIKWEDRFTEGYGKNEYYLLKEGKFFKDCETNRSVLIEKLKEIQKKGNRDDG